MIRVAFFFMLLFATPSLSQTVRVSSGEHDGFTRVVIDFGKPVDWQFGRSDSGYELSGGLAVGMTKEDVRHIMGAPSRSTAVEDEYAGEKRKSVVFVYDNNRVIRIRAGSFAE